MDQVPHVDIDVMADNYRKDFLVVLKEIKPDWKENDLVFKESIKDVSRGLLNTMVRCHRNQDPGDAIMVRIVNAGMNQYLDRSNEVACIHYLNKRHCAPKILATFKTGYCYEFIHGEVLSCLRLREEPIWRCLAEEMARLHAANVDEIPGLPKELQIIEMMRKFVAEYPDAMKDPVKNERYKKELPDKATFEKETEEALAHALTFDPDLVLCHNDTRAENILWNAKTGVAKFVDYEGIGYGYRGYELAAHFQRYGGFGPTDYSLIPDEEFQLRWIRVYLEKYFQETGRKASDVTDRDVRKLYVHTRKLELLYLMVLGVCGPAIDETKLIPDAKLDMLGLSIDAVKEYYKQKEYIMALQLPAETT